jgi:hypothetical protein
MELRGLPSHARARLVVRPARVLGEAEIDGFAAAVEELLAEL